MLSEPTAVPSCCQAPSQHYHGTNGSRRGASYSKPHLHPITAPPVSHCAGQATPHSSEQQFQHCSQFSNTATAAGSLAGLQSTEEPLCVHIRAREQHTWAACPAQPSARRRPPAAGSSAAPGCRCSPADLPAAIRQKAIPRGVPTFETCKTLLSHCCLCRCL